MKLTGKYWDVVWSRPYGRYNRHHQEIWDALLPFISGKIADLGCGACVMYKGKSVDLTGVDWSEEALKQARLNYPTGRYIQADVCHSGLLSGQFDTVVAFGLLDYFDDWTGIVAEMQRLRKPGGKVFATLLNGFQGHLWITDTVQAKTAVLSFRHVCSNWYLIEL